MKARLVKLDHFEYFVKRHWVGPCGIHDFHVQTDSITSEQWDYGALKYASENIPMVGCDRCKAVYAGEILESDGTGYSIFDRPDGSQGRLEPGDLYFNFDKKEHSCHTWNNCEGKHLIAILPNGDHWDIDGRARNCTRKDDKTHRCWIRTGTPPDITVGKDGDTCQAGAGSIQSGDYHGFLRNGHFEP